MNQSFEPLTLRLLPPDGRDLAPLDQAARAYSAATYSADSSASTKPPREFTNPMAERPVFATGTERCAAGPKEPAAL